MSQFSIRADIGGVADLISTRTAAGTFDPISAIEIGANLVISALHSAPRLERLAVQAQRNSSLPGVLQLTAALTAYVFDAHTVGSVSGCDNGAQRLALMSTQSVLVNAYLSVLDTPTAHSSLVRGIIRYHIQNVLSPVLGQLKTVALDMCTSSAVVATGCDAADCVVVSSAWQAHFEFLQSAVAAGKSFMTIPLAPLGPPI